MNQRKLQALERGIWPFTGNSAHYALNAARYMGFTDIRLLGIDMKFDLPKSHIQGINTDRRGNRIRYSPKQIAFWVQELAGMVRQFAGQGVSVVNESPLDGPLDAAGIPKERSSWLKT